MAAVAAVSGHLSEGGKRKMSDTAVDRNVDAEMAALIEQYTAEDEFVVGVVAAKLVVLLEETDPELLVCWLHRHAAAFLCDYIGDRERSRRARARVDADRRRFAAAVGEHENGDSEALRNFAVTYVVDDAQRRKRLADMTGADHTFVAEAYRRSAEVDLMLAAFHRAVAKKVGRRRTADVLSEEQYQRLYDSIVKQPDHATTHPSPS